MASKLWNVQFDRSNDDLGTSLMPSEIRIADNVVESISGLPDKLTLRLKKAIAKLEPKDITVVRELADFGDDTTWNAVSVSEA